MANQCTKFEVSISLCRFRDILGGLKIKKGQVSWSCPLQGQFVIRRLGLPMINLCTKFEVSVFTHYEGMKGNAKCRNWGGDGSPKVAGNVTIQ